MKRLGDWRVPLIFAAPVLVLATVGYLALQPVPGSDRANTVSVTIKENVTPLPTYVPTPYPSVAPGPTCPAHAGITRLSVVAHPYAAPNARMMRWVVVDQSGKPVGCLRVDETLTTANGTYQHYWWTDADGSYRFVEDGTIREQVAFSDPLFRTGVAGSAVWP